MQVKQAEMLVSHYLVMVLASTERLCCSCTQPILARKTKKNYTYVGLNNHRLQDC